MKTVTLEEFKRFGPCWLETPDGRKKLESIGGRKEAWTALDVLDLPEEEVSPKDKLWAVLRPEFVAEETLHEFACRCAEEALKLVENPDPRSVAAIEAKRKWMRGEIGDEELAAARAAAWIVARAATDAARAAAWAAARAARFAADADADSAAWAAARAARFATWSAVDSAARAAARAARFAAAWTAWDAAWTAGAAAGDAAGDAVMASQVEMLKGMLTGEEAQASG